MTVTTATEIAEIVQRVQSWPPPLRIVLACRILETLEGPPAGQPSPERPRSPPAEEVRALFQIDKPAPDDATVVQWIEEHRMAKYGK